MNFLAHVQLSQGIGPVITGNLVADGYKGKKYLELPEPIQHGVILHRKIDSFTDTFEPVLRMKKVLSPYFGRYAPVAMDVYFDHFLSHRWHEFYKNSLEHTVQEVYLHLEKHLPFVNDMSREFIERLIRYQWLNSYRQKNDLAMIFHQMSRRFGINELKNSILPLENHYNELDETFLQLYPLLVAQSDQYISAVGL